MNKLTGLFFALTAALFMVSPAQAAKEKPIRLKMTTQYMDKHPVIQNAIKPWIEEIKKKTDGRVVITYFNPNTVCPDSDVFDAVKNGQVDIGEFLCSRYPGRLAVNTTFDKIPMTISSGMAGAMAYWELFSASPEMQKEFDGLKTLAVHTSAAVQLNTKNKAVRTLEDMRDLKVIGCSKDPIQVLSALGLTGIMQPMPDVYMAMTRNMGDAVLLPVPPLRSFKINEATKYTSFVDIFAGTCWVGMNQKKWDSLPEDVKKVFEETTGITMVKAIATALDNGEKSDIERMTREGHEFIKVSKEEKERWFNMITPSMKAVWMKEIEGKNIADPEAFYQHTIEVMKKNDSEYGRELN